MCKVKDKQTQSAMNPREEKTFSDCLCMNLNVWPELRGDTLRWFAKTIQTWLFLQLLLLLPWFDNLQAMRRCYFVLLQFSYLAVTGIFIDLKLASWPAGLRFGLGRFSSLLANISMKFFLLFVQVHIFICQTVHTRQLKCGSFISHFAPRPIITFARLHFSTNVNFLNYMSIVKPNESLAWDVTHSWYVHLQSKNM